jgi:hypothetical protein
MTDKDKKNIYNALVNLLTGYCNTCMDKHQKEKILMCAFKLELIDYAEQYAQGDVDELWESIARTLGVSLEDGTVVPSKKCNCSNGVCALC